MEAKSKKILVVTWGTRGDIQPMIALCRGFIDAGHEVTLQGPQEGKSMADKFSIPYLTLSGDMAALLSSPDFHRAIQTQNLESLKKINEFEESLGSIGPEILEAAANKDLLVTCFLLAGNVWLVHKKTNIPIVVVTFQPFTPTKELGPFLSSGLFTSDFSKNLALWEKTLDFMGHLCDSAVSKYWKSWGLGSEEPKFGPLGVWSEFHDNKIPQIEAYSIEAIGKRPEDYPDFVKILG